MVNFEHRASYSQTCGLKAHYPSPVCYHIHRHVATRHTIRVQFVITFTDMWPQGTLSESSL